MDTREFERKLKKLVPSVRKVTYSKIKIGNQNFVITEVFVHTTQNHPKNCYMKLGPTCLEDMLKEFEEKKLNEPTS